MHDSSTHGPPAGKGKGNEPSAANGAKSPAPAPKVEVGLADFHEAIEGAATLTSFWTIPRVVVKPPNTQP